jgi:dynein heavy chain
MLNPTPYTQLVFATSKYVAEKMGQAFTESPPIQLAEIYPDTDYKTPIIFVLSSGSDPTVNESMSQ